MNDWEIKDRKLSCKWLTSARLPNTWSLHAQGKPTRLHLWFPWSSLVQKGAVMHGLLGKGKNKQNKSADSDWAIRQTLVATIRQCNSAQSGSGSQGSVVLPLQHSCPTASHGAQALADGSPEQLLGQQSQTLWPSSRFGQHKVFNNKAPPFLQKPVPFSPLKNYPKIPTTCFTHCPNTNKTSN